MKTVTLALEDLKNWPQKYLGKKLAAVLHPASVLPGYKHTLDLLKENNGTLFNLVSLFGPQHGIKGETQDNMIEWDGFNEPDLNIPVYSLYGEFRQPTAKMLEGVEVLLIDMQDIGARYYTFIWTMYLCMQRCEEMGIAIVIHDRPNPLQSTIEEGPVLELDHTSFVGLHSIPVRHSKTIGELAKQFQKECFPKVELEVLEMEGYDKSMWFDETGLPWVLPSPNMPTMETAVIYPGMCLLEGTNLSEGRGTTRPFELFGAPFIDAEKLCEYLNRQGFDGVYFRPFWFIATFHKWAGETCAGAQIHILDRDSVRSFDIAIAILRYCFHTYPEFAWRTQEYEYEAEKLAIDILLGNGWFRKQEIEGKSL